MNRQGNRAAYYLLVRYVAAISSGLERYIIYTMFEFDEAKSESNRIKHGLDFLQIQALWKDSRFLEIPARTVDEPRSLVIGKLKDQHGSVVITYREQNIRIISARRSRDEEKALYESQVI